MVLKETFCANFCPQVPCSGDPDTQPCAVCGWMREEHVTSQQLEEAAKHGQARLIVDRGRFRLFAFHGFRYRCFLSTVHVWRYAAGNSAGDLLGIESHWIIRSKTPEKATRQRTQAKRDATKLAA